MWSAVSHFLFNTTPGYVLQTLPFAAAAGAVWWYLKFRKDKTVPLSKKIRCVLFVCYIAEVVCLVFFFSSIRYFWGVLFLHNKPENIINVLFKKRASNFIPDFYRHINKETVLNVVLFLPFGVLYPLAKSGVNWRQTVLAGLICTACIEALQPVLGRAFDVNDVILNAIGVFISATLFFLFMRVIKRRDREPTASVGAAAEIKSGSEMKAVCPDARDPLAGGHTDGLER